MAEIKPMNYRDIARKQQEEIKKLNDRLDGLRVLIIALCLAVIALGVGGYMGFQKFKTDIEPEIEMKYPVPVEQLKEI